MKLNYYFFLLFFSTIFSFSQEQNQSFNSKRYIDSIFSVKANEIEKNNYESLNKINKIKSDLIEKENSFWADEAFWMITILGGLLALTPLMFWIVEILKNKTFKRINRLERDIKNAQSIVSEYHAFQFYQEYYFEDVIKPTFEKITDILIEISKTKGLDEQVISEITEQFYDFERVVNLLHYDEDKKQQASRYIESRKSDFLKIKMNSILRKISSKNHKLVILELLNSYDNKV
ncbi:MULTISPECIES: hypothetical protein [Flavobacteriaceae]|uniref:hypothetical protein n=1 Tax=Flavobacteriaceae TaxID=49546 RepID=UPI001491DD08|nr:MULTISPECIES: hypothetical protein [Allomuricauda]MDC6364684.1 hypothetical protein [Muricauda sp. AC10]